MTSADQTLLDERQGRPAAFGEAPDRHGRPSPSLVHPQASQFSIEVLDTFDDIAKRCDIWQQLADGCCSPNAYYEPWHLLPAMSTHGRGRQPVFVLVWRQPTDRSTSASLIALFPFEARRHFARTLPINRLEAWQFPHPLLSTPLILDGHATVAWRELLRWAATPASKVDLLEFPWLQLDGPASCGLVDAIREARCHSFVPRMYNRALCRPHDRATGQGLSSRTTKELRRQARRLSELGAVEYSEINDPNAIPAAIEAFLRLENSGWKGRKGASALSDTTDTEYLRQVCASAASRGRVVVLQMCLDGAPIAMKVNLFSGAGSFAFKIAFDERYAKYSPGVQLELYNLEVLQRRPEIRWMDSCARPDHPMINQIWPHQRTIQTVMLAPGSRRGKLSLAATAIKLGARRIMNLDGKQDE